MRREAVLCKHYECCEGTLQGCAVKVLFKGPRATAMLFLKSNSPS